MGVARPTFLAATPILEPRQRNKHALRSGALAAPPKLGQFVLRGLAERAFAGTTVNRPATNRIRDVCGPL